MAVPVTTGPSAVAAVVSTRNRSDSTRSATVTVDRMVDMQTLAVNYPTYSLALTRSLR